MKSGILAIFLACWLCSTSVYADFKDWSKQDRRLYASLVTLQTMDLMQTFTLIDCQQRTLYCPYRESNQLIGPYPSKIEVVLLKAGINLMMYKILDNRIPSNIRTPTLAVLNTISIYPIIHNKQIGLGFYIPIIPYKQLINK